MIIWTYMNIKSQGHALALVQGHSESTLFLNLFFLETAWPTETNFYVESP